MIDMIEAQVKLSDDSMTSSKKLIARYRDVRSYSMQICETLAVEDYVVQPTAEVSPPKWHLGHTTWFFEELLLHRNLPTYSRFNEQYPLLFNSYYKSAGKHWQQASRGQLSRPTVDEIIAYRAHVDDAMYELLADDGANETLNFLLELGLQHEQQHQELLYMDIKYIFAVNPLKPVYRDVPLPRARPITEQWCAIEEGLYIIGHNEQGFAYDNEMPQHKTYLQQFTVCDNTVTNEEYLEFIQDQGYLTARFWLSLGWDWVQDEQIRHPLYWQKYDDGWYEFSLHGQQPLDPNAPVTHISYFEADAYANWKGQRLPTEQELEVYLQHRQSDPSGVDDNLLQPIKADAAVGQVWCWTRSHYSPYPGYRPYQGMVEEYNGKFMCNQFVLRGACSVTPVGHYRHSYRNFYQPQQRWMFSGFRLAKDIL
jgi:ergothioneine biosynthesis protein EgtB